MVEKDRVGILKFKVITNLESLRAVHSFVFAFVSSLLICTAIIFAFPLMKFGGGGHDGYLEIATSLYNGFGFSFDQNTVELHRPPLFPVLLSPAMGFSLLGQKFYLVILNSIFLGLVSAYTNKICFLLSKNAKIAFIASMVILLNPWLIRLLSSPLSAVLQMALYSMVCYYTIWVVKNAHLLATQQKPTTTKVLLMGLLFGVFCLSHGTSVYISLAILGSLSLYFAYKSYSSLAVQSVSVFMIACILIAPWSVRDYQQLGRFEPINSGSGYTYFLGNLYWGLQEEQTDYTKTSNENILLLSGVEGSESSFGYYGILDKDVDRDMIAAMKSHAPSHIPLLFKKSLLNLSEIFLPITHSLYCLSSLDYKNKESCVLSLSTVSLVHVVLRSLLMATILLLALVSIVKHTIPLKSPATMTAIALIVIHLLPYLPIAASSAHGIYSLGTLPILYSLACVGFFTLLQARSTSSKDSGAGHGVGLQAKL